MICLVRLLLVLKNLSLNLKNSFRLSSNTCRAYCMITIKICHFNAISTGRNRLLNSPLKFIVFEFFMNFFFLQNVRKYFNNRLFGNKLQKYLEISYKKYSSYPLKFASVIIKKQLYIFYYLYIFECRFTLRLFT